MPRPFIRFQKFLGSSILHPNVECRWNDKRFFRLVTKKDFDSGAEAEVGIASISHLLGLHMRNDVDSLDRKAIGVCSRSEQPKKAEYPEGPL